MVKDLVPAVEARYSLLEDPGSRGLLGASLGGIASLSTAWFHPGTFQRLCLLSTSFHFKDIGHDEGGHDAFVTAFRRDPGHPARQIYVACGIYEPLISFNRAMIPVLQSTGARVRFVEARDGHNWENWRDRLREGLSWLFPGPLWMVYE